MVVLGSHVYPTGCACVCVRARVTCGLRGLCSNSSFFTLQWTMWSVWRNSTLQNTLLLLSGERFILSAFAVPHCKRERGVRQRQREGERKTEREGVCVCVCMRERHTHRDRERDRDREYGIRKSHSFRPLPFTKGYWWMT